MSDVPWVSTPSGSPRMHGFSPSLRVTAHRSSHLRHRKLSPPRESGRACFIPEHSWDSPFRGFPSDGGSRAHHTRLSLLPLSLGGHRFARVRRNTVRRRSSEKRARSASGFCLPSESVHIATRCYPCGPVDPLLGFLLLRVLSKRTIGSFEPPLLRFVGELRRGSPQVRSSPNRAL